MADDAGGLDGAKLIATGLTVITTVTGLVGTFTGGVPRLLRNNPGHFKGMLVLVLIALLLTFVASALAQPNLTTTRVLGAAPDTVTRTTTGTTASQPAKIARFVLSGLGLVLFSWAALVLFDGMSKSTGTADQPRLSASWTFPTGQRPVLTVKMQLDNLTAKQTVYVNVTPLGAPISQSIYRSQTGADADGVADATFDVLLPAGKAGLQIVVAVDHPTTCQGVPIPELVVPTASNAASINASATLSPSPTARSTPTAGVSPPVKSDDLNFSCIQIAAPPTVSSPTSSTSTVTTPARARSGRLTSTARPSSTRCRPRISRSAAS
ncbi:hypothetical protein [Jatrophihabitans sp.]|jgi:hypothetical protein|uniref:hypothetical protein n=1 Tax=Jatrophihabitans sp. TaxID=1932789 RepID=UPI002EE1F1FA